MLDAAADVMNLLLGLDADSLTIAQCVARAVVVYVAAIVYVRIGDKRFLGKHTALDVVLGFMLGSILSRGITGNADFGQTLAAALTLVLLHSLIAVASFHSDRFGTLVKGSSRELVRDGELDWDAMRGGQITRQDLEAGLRSSGNLDDVGKVRSAHLERDGSISVVKQDTTPHVLDIRVEAGVQMVRIKVE